MTRLRYAVLMSLTLAFAGLMLTSANAANLAASAEPTCSAPVELKPCCYEPCFKYINHRFAARKVCCCTCEPPVKAVLSAVDPRCCCTVDVPVCVPACCKGQPEVCSRCALFGRAIVEYKWCCGYRIKLVFGQCGKVDVHYYGLK